MWRRSADLGPAARRDHRSRYGGAAGVSPSSIDDALYDAFGQRQAATMYTGLNQYRVVLEVSPSLQAGPEALGHIYVRSLLPAAAAGTSMVASGTGASAGGSLLGPPGNLVPLSAVARPRPTFTSLSVNHQGQFPSITISFNTAPGVALGQAVDAVHRIERELGLPPSVRAAFAGSAQAFGSSLANEPTLILAALLVVYIVLGMLYESYIHPITILRLCRRPASVRCWRCCCAGPSFRSSRSSASSCSSAS